MVSRLEPFINGSTYHIYNKTIESKEIFNTELYCDLFLRIKKYYRSKDANISFSSTPRLDPAIAKSYFIKVNSPKSFQVNIIAYCLMPTHFHILLKQIKDNGIVKFMSNIINSLTRFYNIKNDRKGPLFLPVFKSVQVTNEAQFMHVSRYIHLNPYSGGLIDDINDLINYPWSSYDKYINGQDDSLITKTDLLELFNDDKIRYRNFVLSNAEHQKTLEYIKYSEKW